MPSMPASSHELGPRPSARFPVCEHRGRWSGTSPNSTSAAARPDRRPDDRRVQGALDHINALADRSPGFVWRLQTDEGNATALHPIDDDELVAINMSVWESIEALADYVYRSDHTAFLRRRREWFERYGTAYLVLWWVPQGTSRRSTRRWPGSTSSSGRTDPRHPPSLRQAVRPPRSRRPNSPPSTGATGCVQAAYLPGGGRVRRRGGRGRRCRSTGGAACSSPVPRSGGCAHG